MPRAGKTELIEICFQMQAKVGGWIAVISVVEVRENVSVLPLLYGRLESSSGHLQLICEKFKIVRVQFQLLEDYSQIVI